MLFLTARYNYEDDISNIIIKYFKHPITNYTNGVKYRIQFHETVSESKINNNTIIVT